MEIDKISIASDFSIIPENMMNDGENEAPPTPMSASFFRSEPSSEATATPNPQFTKVAFYAVEKVTSEAQAPLSVIFSVSEDFTPKSSDRIALYKVGFTSSKDFLCFKWAPTSPELESTHPFTVLFEAKLLPRDRESLYQMCYLMQNGKIAGVSSPFNLTQTERPGPNKIIEEAARNVLSIRINELVKENEGMKEEMQKKEEELVKIKADYTHLESEMKTLETSLENCQEAIKNSKEFAIEKDQTIQKLKQGISEKEEELKHEKMQTQEVEDKLALATQTMNELKESLVTTEQGKSITEERHEVLIQDNEELKETLSVVKDELKNSLKEKAAAEKIASDLSQRLQTVCAEYQNMVAINLKLTKKVKKLRRAVALMDTDMSDDWLCIGDEGEDKKEDSKETSCEDEDERPELVGDSAVSSCVGAVVAASCASAPCSRLTETVSSVRQMMDDIVSQLSLQTEEMKCLKQEIARRNEGQQDSRLEEPMAPPEDSQMLVDSYENPTASKDRQKVDSDENAAPSSAERKEVDCQTRLFPVSCTVPVTIAACATKLSLPSSQAHQPSPLSPTTNSVGSFPAPLIPEITPIARQAAVLSHFAEDNHALVSLDDVQPPPAPLIPSDAITTKTPHQDSDDDDYHSTGDVGEPPSPLPFKCPLCPLEFLPTAFRLMEEHINNHLDRTCPVCSIVFQTNVLQKTFEDHVYSHFDIPRCNGQRIQPNPSAPWDPRNTPISFDLLEID